MEAAGLEGLQHNEPAYIHLVLEALKRAFSDREHHYGDPAVLDVDIARLLSADHAAAWAQTIDPDRAAPGLPEPLFGVAQPLPAPARTTEP